MPEGLPFAKEKYPSCRTILPAQGERSPPMALKYTYIYPCISNACVIKPFAERLQSHLAADF